MKLSSLYSPPDLWVECGLLFTQRLVLQHEFETSLYEHSNFTGDFGSGLSNAEFELRLRYEFNSQFAPYIGVGLSRSFGSTADFVRDNYQSILGL